MCRVPNVARAAVEGVVCGMLEALDALRRHAEVDAVVLTGGGARSEALRSVFAGLCDVPVSITDADEAVATGACVQAAAVATDEPHHAVAARWQLAAATTVVADQVDRHSVRARYADTRQAAYPST